MEDVVLVNVCLLMLSIETTGSGVFTKLIHCHPHVQESDVLHHS